MQRDQSGRAAVVSRRSLLRDRITDLGSGPLRPMQGLQLYQLLSALCLWRLRKAPASMGSDRSAAFFNGHITAV